MPVHNFADPAPMSLADYDFDLPEERIAQDAIEPRDSARLLVYDSGHIHHRRAYDLATIIQPGDLLVLNRTRVIPARLYGHKASGGAVEVLLIHPTATSTPESETWRCMIRGKVRQGTRILLGDVSTTVSALHADGERDLSFPPGCGVLDLAQQIGKVPLPPYIQRDATETDAERYQTVFGDKPGSVAAPTASLHLTDNLLKAIADRGIDTAKVELQVGPGTFKPVTCDNVDEHPMHAEWACCPPETVAQIAATKAAGGRIFAVGTTVVRTLESAAQQDGGFGPWSGWTQLFLRPPHHFQIVDGLLTNFHLPRSTLLMLVACSMGVPELQRCYHTAIEHRYRFYSYGDAMLILPPREPTHG